MKMETGERHGRLVAVRKSSERAGNKFKWEWRCDCGRLILCPVSRVRCGDTQSCGCLRAENATKVGAARARAGKTSRANVISAPRPAATAVTRSKLCEGLPMRDFKPLTGHAERLQRHAAMCEASR